MGENYHYLHYLAYNYHLFMNTIIDRIQQVAINEGITLTSLERIIGASKGVLSRAFANKSDIQSKWVQAIAENYPLYNAEWLITGKGVMLKTEQKPGPKPYDTESPTETTLSEPGPEMSVYRLKTDYFGVDKQNIPLYDIQAAAGLNLIFGNQNTQIPIDYISIPNAPKCDAAIFVRGDSMYPVLKAGDIICYKTILEPQNIRFGEMYLLCIEDESDTYLTVKYLQRSDRADYVKLVSENRHHAEKEEHISHIKALAIIKLSIRYNTIS
jgi:phage repressor protein C with HTH and peptisase S24 domain